MSTAALMGLSLLVIGDSHLATPNYLIGPLHDRLMEQGAQVHSIGVCGVHAADWLKVSPGDCGRAERRGKAEAVRISDGATTTPIKELIAQDKPDAVVVVIGDTIGSYTNPEFPKSWAYQQVTSLTKAIAETGTACYWVGPGWSNTPGRFNKTNERVQVINAFLAENTAPCTYIDSTKFSQPGEWKTMDGQHYLSSGYQKWAAAITDAIVSNPPKKKAP
ncbi:MAG: SGNH/GDSL hydrolase family protein [Halothiobacillaceae bacterium]